MAPAPSSSSPDAAMACVWLTVLPASDRLTSPVAVRPVLLTVPMPRFLPLRKLTAASLLAALPPASVSTWLVAPLSV